MSRKGKKGKVQVSIDGVSVTIELEAGAWADRLEDMADEEDPQEAALVQLAEELEGVDVDGPEGRAWVAFSGDASLI